MVGGFVSHTGSQSRPWWFSPQFPGFQCRAAPCSSPRRSSPSCWGWCATLSSEGWGMTKRRERHLLLAIAMIPLLILGGLAVNTLLDVPWLADQSAQAALDKEISDQLAAVPPGQSYPDSLSELALTYPD